MSLSQAGQQVANGSGASGPPDHSGKHKLIRYLTAIALTIGVFSSLTVILTYVRVFPSLLWEHTRTPGPTASISRASLPSAGSGKQTNPITPSPASPSTSPASPASNGNTYEDDFQRPDQNGFGGSTSTHGAAQFGWYGDADGTHSYDAISNRTGQLGFSGTAGYPNIAFAGKTAYSGGDALAEFSISVTGSVGFQIPFDVCGDKSCDYAARLNTNASLIELGKRVNGTTSIGISAPFTAVAGTVYWMRANYDPGSGTLRMRIWPAGTAEPTSWNLSWTDSGTRLSSNLTGVGSWAASSTTATASVHCYAFSPSPAVPAQPCGSSNPQSATR
jgi:hypothetical protein